MRNVENRTFISAIYSTVFIVTRLEKATRRDIVGNINFRQAIKFVVNIKITYAPLQNGNVTFQASFK